MRILALASLSLVACGSPTPPPTVSPSAPAGSAAPAPPRATAYTPRPIPLPGATADGVGMDYLVYDPSTDAVWVPAGNTGAVDVVDGASGKVTQITGFPTQEVERRGAKRLVGPSAASLGEGVVYIGSRGDSSICAVDARTHVKGACGKLDAMPDGVAYVAPTHEVWVTTPRDNSLRILDATTLAQKGKIALEAGPEGFAVDAQRGRFYTSYEDKDQTLAIDLASHQIVATWKTGCGEEGPRGLRLAAADGLLFVACTNKIEALALDHDGAVVGSIPTGDGVDDFDYVAATRTLYAAAGGAGTLTIAAVDATGAMSAVATVPTAAGARNGVVTRDGIVYVAHGKAGELIALTPAGR